MGSTLADRLTNYDATALAEAIAKKRLSAAEVMKAHLERIKQENEKYNAIVTLDEHHAMQRAIAADYDLARGISWGPLHGVPITIKDALQTKDLRTTVGFAAFRDAVPDRDAWVVNKLKQAGAIVIGKTNCAMLCGDIQTTNEIFGTTKNPWNPERTSGGSSGGEAVAVAVGMSPLGVGSDTGGSIRIPASYCGVFGFKPSSGAIPTDGLLPPAEESHAKQDSLSTIGPIARSVRDLQLFQRVVTDHADVDDIPQHPRIFWTQDFKGAELEDDVAQTLSARHTDLLAQGVRVATVEAPTSLRSLLVSFMNLHMYEFGRKETSPVMYYLFWFKELIRALVFGGLRRTYAREKRQQAALIGKYAQFMKDCDCWVVPATPTVAFPHQNVGWPIPFKRNGRQTRRGYYPTSMGFTCPFNLLGNPTVVIPVGESADGLPIALQVVGKVGEDAKVLKLAAYIWGALNSVPNAKRVGAEDFVSERNASAATETVG